MDSFRLDSVKKMERRFRSTTPDMKAVLQRRTNLGFIYSFKGDSFNGQIFHLVCLKKKRKPLGDSQFVARSILAAKPDDTITCGRVGSKTLFDYSDLQVKTSFDGQTMQICVCTPEEYTLSSLLLSPRFLGKCYDLNTFVLFLSKVLMSNLLEIWKSLSMVSS